MGKGTLNWQIEPGDILQLRKTHPCGSRTWRVRRIGADIGLICEGCGHAIMMDREQLIKRIVHLEKPGNRI